MTVQILLSTYNGADYLKPLLDSLLQQDYPHIKILIRDDGSSDDTVKILQSYAATHDHIQVILGENLGFVQSFLQLVTLASSTIDYFAFCDQDDVWLPDKISRSVQAIRSYSQATPVLYGARATIVDAVLNPLGYSQVPGKQLSFQNALVECSLTGCTSLFNQATRQLLLRQLPLFAYSHDWWVYLVAAAFGEVVYDRESRILYRQHDKNVFGVVTMEVEQTQNLINAFALRINQWQRRIDRFFTEGPHRRVVKQAEEFQRIYAPLLSNSDRNSLETFLNSRTSLLTRLKSALLSDVYRQSLSGTLILKLLMICDRL